VVVIGRQFCTPFDKNVQRRSVQVGSAETMQRSVNDHWDTKLCVHYTLCVGATEFGRKPVTSTGSGLTTSTCTPRWDPFINTSCHLGAYKGLHPSLAQRRSRRVSTSIGAARRDQRGHAPCISSISCPLVLQYCCSLKVK